MLISSAYPSKYLKSTDLQGRAVRVAISHVAMEDVGDDGQKPVVYFQGKERGMVLNQTNANYIAAYLGEETDGWGGHQIELYVTKVQFGAKMVDGLRVRIPSNSEAAPPAPVAPPAPDIDDEIPF